MANKTCGNCGNCKKLRDDIAHGFCRAISRLIYLSDTPDKHVKDNNCEWIPQGGIAASGDTTRSTAVIVATVEPVPESDWLKKMNAARRKMGYHELGPPINEGSE